MHNLLITGGAGFIGANFVHYWMQNYPQDKVIVLDALTYAGKKENLQTYFTNNNFKLYIGDICDEELILKILMDEHIDTLVHFAAESHVDRSISGPDVFLKTNIIGTHQLLKAARKVWLEQNNLNKPYRFHHISTDEVYGSLAADDPAFSETTRYAPNSPYSASKASSDHIVRAYHHTYGLPITMSNCSNNYGPFQFPEKLIPLFITNALQGKKLPIYGDGKNIRDWLYVEDHCRGIDLILKKGRLGEVYNIGGNNEFTNIEIANLLSELIDQTFFENTDLKKRFPASPPAEGKSVKQLLEFVTDRPGHDRRYAINPQKIQSELGFKPHESFTSGLKKTLYWYIGNEGWWNTSVFCHPARADARCGVSHELRLVGPAIESRDDV